MAEFHVGDAVKFLPPFDWMEGFVITEVHSDGVHFTGEGRAWWPEKVLDHAVPPSQRSAALEFERALHEFYVARKRYEKALVQARAMLSIATIDAIEDAARP
jgi:hypothetical protein